MTARTPRSGFAARPGDAERWIKAPAPAAPPCDGVDEAFTARLTIDVTPTTRRRLKFAAQQRGTTVADMLRTLLAREFPETEGDQP